MKIMNMKEALDEACRLIESGRDMCLVTIAESSGSTPRSIDAFMFVDIKGNIWGTVGGGKVEFASINDAKSFIEKKESGTKQYFLDSSSRENLQMICGGNISAKFEFIPSGTNCDSLKSRLIPQDENKGRAIIFGGGHVGSHLSKVLNYLGFDCIVWDDRKECLNNEYDEGVKLIIESYNNVDDKLHISKNDYVMIMTSGHISDLDLLKQILKTSPWYLGCIGSSSKTNFIREELSKYGYKTEEIDKIHLPIGVKIGAESPEEIAISIAAELIASRSIKENRRKAPKSI